MKGRASLTWSLALVKSAYAKSLRAADFSVFARESLEASGDYDFKSAEGDG